MIGEGEWETGNGILAPQGGLASRSTGDETLLTRFYWEAKEIRAAADGMPKYEDVEFIEIRQPGARDALYEGPVTESHRQRWPDRYKRWQEKRQSPREGLPLEHWPLMTKAEVLELQEAKVFTVQELANVPDSNLKNLGLFAGQKTKKARDFLANAKDGALLSVLRTENEKLKEEIDFERKRIAYLETQMKEIVENRAPAAHAPAQNAVDINALVAQAVAQAVAALPHQETKGKKKVLNVPTDEEANG